ncbi:TonB family protein [Qipengyuania sp. JC766]|uniref:energy transducer TonB n=1 Tax=Qipengyuania sp. JC766 TaxID=3232139 RepID=UPI00345A50D5
MAYVDNTSGSERTTAIAGVALVHVGIGAALLAGLATSVIVPPTAPAPKATDVFITIPPAPPEPTQTASEREVQSPDTTPPVPHIPPSTNDPLTDTRQTTGPALPNDDWLFEDPGTGTATGTPGPTGTPSSRPSPTPSPSFDPVSARPSNDASRWIRDSDFRTAWINRGYEGTVGFRVSIDTRGRVTDCAVTRGSGYAPLDSATCKLVAERARFTPARDTKGATVSGTYTGAVRWQVPN